MPQSCSICSHKDKAAINEAIVNGAPNRRIAAQYGLTEQAIRRHKKAGHIAGSLVKATAATEVTRADDLLSQITDLRERALSLLDRAESGSVKDNAIALREVRGMVELLAKVRGEIDSGTRVQVSVNSLLISPEWGILCKVLKKFPEINEELSTALKEAGL